MYAVLSTKWCKHPVLLEMMRLRDSFGCLWVFFYGKTKTIKNEEREKRMSLVELFILAVGLSMDAFAVSICKGLSLGKISKKHMAIAGAWFGAFRH